MKRVFIFLIIVTAVTFSSKAALLLNNYGYLQNITFELYTDAVTPYKMPEQLQSTEESLMYEVLHAVWKEDHWVAYTLNKDLLGTYKVGQPAILDGDVSRKMYFVATFPGSLGGQDLYVSEYLNGVWSKPKNLGRGVNTEKNESNPGLLNEHTLTYSSGGIIKKLDLNSFKVSDVEDAQTNTATAAQVASQPTIQPSTASAESVKAVASTETIVKSAPSMATSVSPVVSAGAVSGEFLGNKSREEMLAKYKTAIQLGAFSVVKWDLFSAVSKLGKLVYYKNDKDINVVWLTGFSSRAAAEVAILQIKAMPGFENAYITGK